MTRADDKCRHPFLGESTNDEGERRRRNWALRAQRHQICKTFSIKRSMQQSTIFLKNPAGFGSSMVVAFDGRSGSRLLPRLHG